MCGATTRKLFTMLAFIVEVGKHFPSVCTAAGFGVFLTIKAD